MYSYRDAKTTRGLKRQGVRSTGPVPGCLFKLYISCGYNAGRSYSTQHNDRQDVHLKCPWRAAMCANSLDAGHVAVCPRLRTWSDTIGGKDSQFETEAMKTAGGMAVARFDKQ